MLDNRPPYIPTKEDERMALLIHKYGSLIVMSYIFAILGRRNLLGSICDDVEEAIRETEEAVRRSLSTPRDTPDA